MSAPEADKAPGAAALRVLARIAAIWDRVERVLVGLLGAFAMAIAAFQVFGRYIAPGASITWAEEVIVYVAVWAVMIVASQLVRMDAHVRPDLVLRLLWPGIQRWFEMFNCLVAIVFTFGMVWYGWTVVGTALMLDQTQLVRSAIPALDLLSRLADRRCADARALSRSGSLGTRSSSMRQR